MTHSVYEHHAVTWRHRNFPGLSLEVLIKLRQYTWSGSVPWRHLCERKDYRVFRQKTVNIYIAISNILRRRLVCECITTTSSHLHPLQFPQAVLVTSERAMFNLSDIENNLSMKTHCFKAVIRLASTSSCGWCSSDKMHNTRQSRKPRSLRAALLRLVVCDTIKRNAIIQNTLPTSID